MSRASKSVNLGGRFGSHGPVGVAAMFSTAPKTQMINTGNHILMSGDHERFVTGGRTLKK